jgi:hypothetical protein
MSKKTLAAIGALLVIIIGYYLWANRDSSAGEAADTSDSTVSGMRVEDNAVAAFDQKSGETVTVSQVYLAQPGYVVVHEDAAGSPGAIVGTSALLPAGQSDSVVVQLSRESVEGERLYAMVHLEANNDGTFSAADAPAPSTLGGPIMGTFMISSEAQSPVDVTL